MERSRIDLDRGTLKRGTVVKYRDNKKKSYNDKKLVISDYNLVNIHESLNIYSYNAVMFMYLVSDNTTIVKFYDPNLNQQLFGDEMLLRIVLEFSLTF